MPPKSFLLNGKTEVSGWQHIFDMKFTGIVHEIYDDYTNIVEYVDGVKHGYAYLVNSNNRISMVAYYDKYTIKSLSNTIDKNGEIDIRKL